MQVNALSRSIAVVDKDGKPTQELNLFSEAVAQLQIIIGIGSPEGLIEAQVGREYLDTTGGAGAVKYIKQLNDIGGDRKMGWVAI